MIDLAQQTPLQEVEVGRKLTGKVLAGDVEVIVKGHSNRHVRSRVTCQFMV